MRVKIGETATATLNVNVAYRCSSCGHNNIAEQAITGTAQTSTIAGINLSNNLTTKAREDLYEKLAIALDKNSISRFRILKFNCKCRHCGYQEPWARMHQPVLDTIRGILWGVLILASLLLFASFSDGGSIGAFVFVVGCIAGILCVRHFIAKHNDEMEFLIATLPPESLPTILPLTKDRTPSSPASTPSYGAWMCQHCGIQNSTQYSQCKKCGTFRGQ